MIAMPGSANFAGEFLILVGSFLTARWWTVVAAAGASAGRDTCAASRIVAAPRLKISCSSIRSSSRAASVSTVASETRPGAAACGWYREAYRDRPFVRVLDGPRSQRVVLVPWTFETGPLIVAATLDTGEGFDPEIGEDGEGRPGPHASSTR